MKELSDRAREIRRTIGITPRRAAEILGVSVAELREAERTCTANPDGLVFHRMITRLEVSADWLFDGIGEPFNYLPPSMQDEAVARREPDENETLQKAAAMLAQPSFYSEAVIGFIDQYHKQFSESQRQESKPVCDIVRISDYLK